MQVASDEIAVARRQKSKSDSPYTRHLADGSKTVCGIRLVSVQSLSPGNSVPDNTPRCRNCERLVEEHEAAIKYGRST